MLVGIANLWTVLNSVVVELLYWFVPYLHFEDQWSYQISLVQKTIKKERIIQIYTNWSIAIASEVGP